jgi:general secretion pathway protein A
VQPQAFRALADPIYEAFYGLSDQPFAITTDPKFFYLSNSHQHAFSELLNGLRRREGMLLLTGETGTGKTTLCRAVLESLGSRTFSAMILNPYMSGAEVFRIVLRDFGLVSPEDLRRGALATTDVPQLLDAIETFLRSLVAIESHAVIVLDEAQSLSPQVLDQIRLLTALEKDNRRLVQVVLCGQPSLLQTLKTPPMLALNERITRRVTLAPLSAGEVHAYIQHRLAIAGGMHSVTFGPEATRIVGELSQGLPRRINVLCDRALEEGRFDGVNVMTPDLVKRAARSVGMTEPTPVEEAKPAVEPPAEPSLSFGQTHDEPAARSRTIAVAIAAVLAALLLAFGVYAWTIVSAVAVPAMAPIERPAGRIAGPLPVPSDEEILARLTPRPRVFVAPPLEPAPASSAELPDNPNQFN